MGLRPSFFLFLLMAAVAAALVVVGDAALVLPPFAGPVPTAPVIDGVLAPCACACAEAG